SGIVVRRTDEAAARFKPVGIVVAAAIGTRRIHNQRVLLPIPVIDLREARPAVGRRVERGLGHPHRTGNVFPEVIAKLPARDLLHKVALDIDGDRVKPLVPGSDINGISAIFFIKSSRSLADSTPFSRKALLTGSPSVRP